MTDTTNKGAAAGEEAAVVPQVTFQIDGIETSVPKGTLVIRAAEEVGITIPRFCDHPLLEPAGACRQCLVEVSAPDRSGTVRPMPKPQTSCTLVATDGMQVSTQRTSPVAEKAQRGIMELLLINHPLDCPVCDKGGECPLQNQSMANGSATSRYIDVKRTFPKPIAVSTQILLDRERCVLCQRCTRFSDEIAGDPFIDLQKRGARQQIGRFDEDVLDFERPESSTGDQPIGAAHIDVSGSPFASYYSGNTVQICPVGALTSAAYRFRSRPFDLISTPSIAEHDSCGSAIRIDHRRDTVMRRLAGDDPLVNEEWITDKDRFAFTWQTAPDRLSTPLVRDREADGTRGELRPASWSDALERAADGLASARDGGGVGVLPGGRLTIEDAYAYAKFARVVLNTNDVDHRARSHSDEEADFLGHAIAGHGIDVTLPDLEKAPAVLLVGFEAEEEGGITFLRLRKGATKNGVKVFSIASHASAGLDRMNGTLLAAAPGTEPEWLDQIAANDSVADEVSEVTEALNADGAIVVVGERLAAVPGAYSSVARLAERTGARLAWIPRRIGERGGVETGTLPGLLPGGRPVTDAEARVDVAAAWNVDTLPDEPGRSTSDIFDALWVGQLDGVLAGGFELADLPDPAHARRALEHARFVVALDVRSSEITALADVVFPVAPPVEKGGSYWNWEGRVRAFGAALHTSALPDFRVLNALADELDIELGTATADEVREDLGRLGPWDGARVQVPAVAPAEPEPVAPGTAVLAAWRLQLDVGRLQDGERFLAGTAKRAVARVSPVTAASIGIVDGGQITVATDRGSLTLPVSVTPMVDHVVWVPLRSPGSQVHEMLGVAPGAVVRIASAAGEGEA